MPADSDAATLFARAVEAFQARVRVVGDDAWGRPTPCSDWDVRALVNHVVGEQRWVVPLMDGRTIQDVGDAIDGDLLGSAPREAADTAAKDAVASMREPGALDRTVHLSFGDTGAAEYAWQLIADHVVHAWDLAVAVGADARLDHDLVAGVGQWWVGREELYRRAGLIADRVPVPAHASRQDRLLASFGRDPSWSAVRAVVTRFNAAWEAWDLEAIVACLAEDAVFESTDPAPDGRRFEGRDEIAEEWRGMFEATRGAAFIVEDSVVCGDRATVRWRFAWRNDDGSPGHVRGIDLIRVAGGRIAEKLSYVKG
jgi:uncharacterized protein (TIGR03086 family)